MLDKRASACEGCGRFDFVVKFGRMTVYENLEPIDLTEIRTYELRERPSKVTVDSFAKPVAAGDSLAGFLAKLPGILAVESLRAIKTN